MLMYLLANTLNAQTPCTDGFAGTYPCNNVDLLSKMTLAEIQGGNNTNDIWGWVSPATGKEYALVGCHSGTSFVDVSDPVNPIYIGRLLSHTDPSLWRDLETYNNYAFIVSEASGHGLQIFDLLQLDTATNLPVEFEETAYYSAFGHCHTIDINEESGYAYCNGTNTFGGGPHIVNIQDPLNPFLAGGFSGEGYTHDCHVITYYGPDADYYGHEIAMCCNNSVLAVVDVTDKSDCFTIHSDTYQGNGYCHQGWFTKDLTRFLVDDETDELDFGVNTRTHIFDVTDLDNVVHMGVFEGEDASIDHNLYVKDNFVFESNYTAGVRILDAIKIETAVMGEVAFFDLYPDNNNAVFTGTWSNYPFLPSGIVLATSMNYGFFVLRPNMITTDQDSWSVCGGVDISFVVSVNSNLNFPLMPEIEGLPGDAQVVSDAFTEPESLVITLTNLGSVPPGSYDFVLALTTLFAGQYEIPLHLDISDGTPVTPLLVSPADQVALNGEENIVFSWEENENGGFYTFQLATDDAFVDLVDEQLTSEASYDPLFDLPEGVYYWRVKSINECGESEYSEAYMFSVIFTGIGTFSVDSSVLFPNPSDGMLHYYSPVAFDGIQILDVTGRILKELHFPPSTMGSIDVSDIPPGTYFLHSGSKVMQFCRE